MNKQSGPPPNRCAAEPLFDNRTAMIIATFVSIGAAGVVGILYGAYRVASHFLGR